MLILSDSVKSQRLPTHLPKLFSLKTRTPLLQPLPKPFCNRCLSYKSLSLFGNGYTKLHLHSQLPRRLEVDRELRMGTGNSQRLKLCRISE